MTADVGGVIVFINGEPFDDDRGIPLRRYPWHVEMSKPRVDDARERLVTRSLDQFGSE
jgi:hypothetical protein